MSALFTFWCDDLPFLAHRTTMGVWMVAITQPTVRVSLNSVGTSLMTTRCLTSPPPRSSPPQPTFCSTPPCDGAVGPQEETLHLSSDAQRERGCLISLKIESIWGLGRRSSKVTGHVHACKAILKRVRGSPPSLQTRRVSRKWALHLFVILII